MTAQAEQQAQAYLTGIHEAVESERNKPLPKKMRAENVAYREEIKIKYQNNGSIFRQLQEATRKDSARDALYGMVADMMIAFSEELICYLISPDGRKTRAFTAHLSVAITAEAQNNN